MTSTAHPSVEIAGRLIQRLGPFFYQISAAERSTADRWFAAAQPFGISEIEWELWDRSDDDGFRAPCLCISVVEHDECSYTVEAPVRPNSADWTIMFVDAEGSPEWWGPFLSLTAALNRIRPCLIEGQPSN